MNKPSVIVSSRLPEPLYERAKREAEEDQRTMSNLIIVAVTHYLDAKDKLK